MGDDIHRKLTGADKKRGLARYRSLDGRGGVVFAFLGSGCVMRGTALEAPRVVMIAAATPPSTAQAARVRELGAVLTQRVEYRSFMYAVCRKPAYGPRLLGARVWNGESHETSSAAEGCRSKNYDLAVLLVNFGLQPWTASHAAAIVLARLVLPVQIHSKPFTEFRASGFSALRLGVVAVVEKPFADSVAQDFTFDDAPPCFERADDRDDDGPFWLWALVRESSAPRQQVWVRYGAEEAPADCYVQAARVPDPGSTGVRIVSDVDVDTLDAPARRSHVAVRNDEVRDVPANVRLLTTPAAAKYCGFRSCSGLRKASRRGLVKPAGRRGHTGPFVWDVDELDRFLESSNGKDVGETVGLRSLGETGSSRRVRNEGRRVLAACQGDGSEDGADEGGDADRSRHVDQPSDQRTPSAGRKGSKRDRLSEAKDAALLRIRRLAHGSEDQDRSDS